MKKLLLTLFMATLSAISFAQANYGKYSMQHSTSEADLQQYIGQHVKLMPYNGFSLYTLKSATIIQYTIKGRFMSR